MQRRQTTTPPLVLPTLGHYPLRSTQFYLRTPSNGSYISMQCGFQSYRVPVTSSNSLMLTTRIRSLA